LDPRKEYRGQGPMPVSGRKLETQDQSQSEALHK
jgi:hypothetical protein